MNIQDYKEENDVLRQRIADLEKTNNELVIHNMQLSQIPVLAREHHVEVPRDD